MLVARPRDGVRLVPSMMAVPEQNSQLRCVRCKRVAVVIIECPAPPVIRSACAKHAAMVIWDIRREFPGHRGIRTRSARED